MTALCLQCVGFTNIDIYEASNRVGGRVFTCKLDASSDPHNYYDVGAMRIPQVDTMFRQVPSAILVGAELTLFPVP